MKFFSSTLAALLLCSISAGCDAVSPLEVPTYAYTAYNEAGMPVVTGFLQFTISPIEGSNWTYTGSIEGSRYLSPVEGIESAGMYSHTQENSLQGSVNWNGGVWIDFNPGTFDSNIILNGSFERENNQGDLTGDWHYSTIVGGVGGGRFEAKRR